jgi:thioredoxin-like negative regulator of GroEL
MLAGVLVLLAGGGCTDTKDNVISTRSEETLRAEIAKTDRPVLVFFYKAGCPTSLALEPGIAQLAKDYRDQITVIRYMHMWPWLQINSLAVARDFKVIICPVVILFSNGEEKDRWFHSYYMPSYRKGILKVLEERAKPPG